MVPAKSPAKCYMQIGEVAERTGLTQRTLRFYEERGLLRPATRLEGGFRLYSEEEVQRVEHIVRLRSLLGFSVADTKRMIEAEEALEEIKLQYRQAPDAEAKRARLVEAIALIEQQEALLAQKMEQLRAVGQRWRAKLERYRVQLDALEGEEPVGSSTLR